MENSFVLNKGMLLLGIVLLPVVLWFLKIRWTKRIVLFGVFFLLVFSRGTFELLGVPSSIFRIGLEFLILIVFTKGVLFNKQAKFKKVVGLIWTIIFIIISLLSTILNELEFMNFILFIRDYLIMVVFFYGVVNTRFSQYEYFILNRLIMFLFLSQIVANILKYALLRDIVEPYIGTMSNLGGSLTVIFALVGVSYCLTSYYINKRKIYLFLSFGFILFALLGGKRAVIVYLPLIYLFILYIYQRHVERLKIKIIRRVFLFSFIVFLVFYLSVRLMPSLNKEREVWGSFDVSYALDYSERYVTTGAGAIAEVGRLEAPTYLFDMMYGDNVYNFVLGYGAGHLIKSKYNIELQRKGSQQELTDSLYGVGYGARTPFLQILLQVGVLGLLVYLFLFFSIFKFSKQAYLKKNADKNILFNYMFFLGFWLIFILDFFTYSNSMLKISTVSFVFFWFLGCNHNIDQKIILK